MGLQGSGKWQNPEEAAIMSMYIYLFIHMFLFVTDLLKGWVIMADVWGSFPGCFRLHGFEVPIKVDLYTIWRVHDSHISK